MESNSTNYLYIGSQGTTAPAGQLMQYQLCDNGVKKPINSGCSTTGVAASASGTAVEFNFGSTPTVSAASATDTDAIVWAIEADGTDIPSNQQFTWMNLSFNNVTFPQAQNGTLYAFDAVSMQKLYSSNDCTSGLDQINPATKFSVPTVANGHVYVATQGPLCFDKGTGTQNGVPDDPAGCFNAGTLYIFGTPTRSCQ